MQIGTAWLVIIHTCTILATRNMQFSQEMALVMQTMDAQHACF